MAAPFRFSVREEDAGLRLDQAIAARVTDISRTLAKKILSEGGVFVDRKRVKVAGRIVRPGQAIEVHLGEAVLGQPERTNVVEVPIVHLCDQYLVVDKPSGVFSAPTPESDRNDLLAFVRSALAEREEQTELHLVHRLDRPTSGLMVLARNSAAAAYLSDQIAAHKAEREYEALLCGALEDETRCNAQVSNKDAHTIFTSSARRGPVTHVTATLLTGRTHQIRLHAEALGAPVAGDSKYGRRMQRSLPSRPPRLALHATRLTFKEPKSNKLATFQSPLPEELAQWFGGLPED